LTEGEVLEIWSSPNATRPPRCGCQKLLRRQGFVPTAIVTDKLRSYGAALRKIGFDCASKDCAPTIELRTRINRSGDANEKSKVSNQPNRLSALFPSMRQFTTHSTCNGI
jgi:putative transposase